MRSLGNGVHASPAANAGRSSIARSGQARIATASNLASPVLFGLYITYAFFFFMNVPARIPGLGVIRPTLLLAVVILGMLFAQGLLFEKKDLSGISRRLNQLLIYMVLTLPFVRWPGSVVVQNLPTFVKAVLFFFLTVKIVDTLPRLRVFLLVFVGCQVLRTYEPLMLHLTTGYWGSEAFMGAGDFLNRLSGAPKDVVNPNGLSYVIITALAFMHYLMTDTGKRWHTLLYVLLAPGMIYALLLTGSRSGAVGFVVLAGIIFFKSNKKAILVVIGVVGLVSAVAVMTPDQRDRYLSIIDSDTKNARTAGTRSSGFIKDIEVGMHRPIFGHGVGTSNEANYNYKGRRYKSHVMYTEVFVELGIIGVVFFLRVLWAIIQQGRRVKRLIAEKRDLLYAKDPEAHSLLTRLGDALEAWIGMALVFSLAQYGLSEYNWYLVAGLAVVLYNSVTKLVRDTDVEAALPARP